MQPAGRGIGSALNLSQFLSSNRTISVTLCGSRLKEIIQHLGNTLIHFHSKTEIRRSVWCLRIKYRVGAGTVFHYMIIVAKRVYDNDIIVISIDFLNL